MKCVIKNSIFISIIITALSFVACSQNVAVESQEPETRSMVNTVKTEEVQIRDFNPVYETTGSLMAHIQTQLKVQVGGEIEMLPAEIGSNVKKGDVLVQIRRVHYELALKQAEANLQQARVVLKDREREKARMTNLFGEGFATEQMRDQSVTGYEQALAAFQQAQAVRDTASQAVKDTTIVAPYDGVVTGRYVDLGGYVGQGGEVLDMMDLSVLNAEIEIPERYAGQIASGIPVIVKISSRNEERSGEIRAVNPRIESASRTFLVKVEVPNPDLSLQSGLFCTVTIPLPEQKNQIAISRYAVIRDEGRSKVWVVENGKAYQRVITEGPALDGYVMITDGLKRTDRVVVDGMGGLSEGADVSET